MEKGPRFGILVAVTYGLVILFTGLAVVAYFWTKPVGDETEANPMRRMMVGAVWVPIYPEATYYEPAMTEQKEITTGSVKFRSKEPAGAVLSFYQSALNEGGFVTLTTGDAGGTVQAVQRGGRVSVTVSVTTSSTNTTGEVRTLNHRENSKKDPAR